MSSSDEAPEETTFSESQIVAKRKEKLLQEARMRETQELKLKRKEKNLKFAEQKLMKEMKKLEEHTIAPPLEEKESTDSEPMPTLKNVKVSEKIALEDSETEKTIAAQVVKQKKTKKFEDTPKAVSKVSKSSNLPPVAVSSHKSRLLSRHSLRR